jgi:hypothetical protein
VRIAAGFTFNNFYMIQSHMVAWLGLGVAAIALAVGIAAFTRTDTIGTDGSNADNGWQEDLREWKRELGLRGISNDLEDLRSDIENNEDVADMREQINDMRKDLSDAYENAEGEARSLWQDLDHQLQQLSSEVETAADQAVNHIERLMNQIRSELDRD